MSDGPPQPAGKATDPMPASSSVGGPRPAAPGEGPRGRSRSPGASSGGGPRPAEDLADVWALLDSLPRASPSQSSAGRLTATTVQMAAVAAGAPLPGSTRSGRREAPAWLAPAAVVVVALFLGVAAGRLTAPSGDARLIDDLPYVTHLDLLREAGSVRFLEALTTREQQPPQRFLRPGVEAAEREADEFRERLTSLVADAGTDRGARRDRVGALALEERVEIEKAARTFARLSGAERQALEALAAALADPAREDLREAAVTWHLWLQPVRPEDRERVIASGTDKRLEWIEWYASRMDGRMRPGFFDRPPGGGPPRGEGFPPRGDGRGAPPDGADGEPRPPRPDPGLIPRGADADGPPALGPRRPPFPGGPPPGSRSFGPPRFRPDGPPPAETPAAPS